MIALFQFNISQMREPYSSKLWDKWKQLVPVIHAQSNGAEGFLWNYDGTVSAAGYIAPYPDDPLIMGNLSAWATPRLLHEFTFGRGQHGALMKHRGHWFMPWPPGMVYHAMWWEKLTDPSDARMSVAYARQKLAMLQANGSSGEVFDWGRVRNLRW